MTNLRELYLANNFLSGSVPVEVCALDLDIMEVTCELVECSCCTSCTGSEIASGGGYSGGEGSGSNNLVNLIVSNSPDNGASLEIPNSPQAAALEWLSRPINEGFSTERLLQRYALATIYFATGGDTGRWTLSSLWLTGSDECQWYSSSDSPSSICLNGGSDNVYVDLDLRQNGLAGSLPDEISMLTALQSLRLAENGLTGTLPSTLAELSELQYLDLAANLLEEEVPPSANVFAPGLKNNGVLFSRLGDMQALTHLSLFQNHFETTIPTTIGLLSSNLRVLDLGSNLLYGTLPSEVQLLTNLVGLSVFNNSLSGSLPDELSGLSNLEMLYLDANDFGPPIPPGICQLTSLSEFWSDCEETQCLCCTTCCSDEFGCVAT
jgi:Leucine-rich repeat (LRR) protein